MSSELKRRKASLLAANVSTLSGRLWFRKLQIRNIRTATGNLLVKQILSTLNVTDDCCVLIVPHIVSLLLAAKEMLC